MGIPGVGNLVPVQNFRGVPGQVQRGSGGQVHRNFSSRPVHDSLNRLTAASLDNGVAECEIIDRFTPAQVYHAGVNGHIVSVAGNPVRRPHVLIVPVSRTALPGVRCLCEKGIQGKE